MTLTLLKRGIPYSAIAEASEEEVPRWFAAMNELDSLEKRNQSG